LENTSFEELSKPEHKPPTISSGAIPPSGSPDLQFPVSFGVVISCRLGDVDRIRSRIEQEGGHIVFQTTSNDDLFLLRKRQVERILQGDTSALAEVHKKKARRGEKI